MPINLKLELSTRYPSLHSDAKRQSPIATAEPRDSKGNTPMVTLLQLIDPLTSLGGRVTKETLNPPKATKWSHYPSANQIFMLQNSKNKQMFLQHSPSSLTHLVALSSHKFS